MPKSDDPIETKPAANPGKKLPPAAERALAEAAQRRETIDRHAASLPKEAGRRDELDPTRYGDWERKGLATDF